MPKILSKVFGGLYLQPLEIVKLGLALYLILMVAIRIPAGKTV
jgi:hypothetical protein